MGDQKFLTVEKHICPFMFSFSIPYGIRIHKLSLCLIELFKLKYTLVQVDPLDGEYSYLIPTYIYIGFLETGFLYITAPGCPGTHFIDQPVLKLLEIHMTLLLECRD
jgi:hypothetical protein